MLPWRHKDKLLRFTSYLNYVVVTMASAVMLGYDQIIYLYIAMLMVWLPCMVICFIRIRRYDKLCAGTRLPEDFEEEAIIRARQVLAAKRRDA